MYNRFFSEGEVEERRKRNQVIHFQYVGKKAYENAMKKDERSLTITANTLRMPRKEFEQRHCCGTLPDYKSR